jgi:2-polyprenyl-6-methoxyphenol hydroxylase-like FAD-dependent oxidoreductase
VLLSVVYEHIKDKSKVLLKKSLSKVTHSDDSVTIACEDGTEYIGDVLIGCDGINSKVRSEMWRLADAASPGTIPESDRKAVFADYRCLFGISSRIPGTTLGELNVCFWEKKSFLLIIGKDYRTYFFLTQKYPKRREFGEIPRRYTQEETDIFAEKNLDRNITTNLKFRDIWERREVASLVPTEEAEFKLWHWGRIACVGDSIHKMTPQAGQGGNIAVESAAAMANKLFNLNKQANGKNPTLHEIQAAFEQYQKKRTARVTSMMRSGNDLTRLQALDTPLHVILAKYVVPALGDYLTDLISDGIVGAELLDYLPPPHRSLLGTMPFNPEQGTSFAESRVKRALWALPLLGISYVGFKTIDISEYASTFSKFAEQRRFDSESVSVPLTWIRCGNTRIDGTTSFLTAFFSQIVMGFDTITYWQNLTFLTDFTGFWAIMLFESSRRANKLTPMQT